MNIPNANNYPSSKPGFCAVHNGNGVEVKHSLALRKEGGKWVITPVCLRCRGELISQAKKEGKFLPFYELEMSAKEAAKRNEETAMYRPFLDKFAKAVSSKRT